MKTEKLKLSFQCFWLRVDCLGTRKRNKSMTFSFPRVINKFLLHTVTIHCQAEQRRENIEISNKWLHVLFDLTSNSQRLYQKKYVTVNHENWKWDLGNFFAKLNPQFISCFLINWPGSKSIFWIRWIIRAKNCVPHYGPNWLLIDPLLASLTV